MAGKKKCLKQQMEQRDHDGTYYGGEWKYLRDVSFVATTRQERACVGDAAE
jgi:hypothetical protein